jgi:aspartyl-tRNA synthetase
MAVAEELLQNIFTAAGHTIPKQFNRMTYNDAMEIYGSDKPDMRFDMPMVDVIDIFANSTNEIFADIAKDPKKNRIKALRCPNGDNIFSKRQMKGFEDYVRNLVHMVLDIFK